MLMTSRLGLDLYWRTLLLSVMPRPILAIVLVALVGSHSETWAAEWQPSGGHVQAPIWPGAVPDAMRDPKPESVDSGGGAFNVSRPTMTMYAAIGRNSGAAIVVFPGGGYQALRSGGETGMARNTSMYFALRAAADRVSRLP